jgi:hypothetical protein
MSITSALRRPGQPSLSSLSPSASTLKQLLTQAAVNELAVLVLLEPIKFMVRSSSGKFGVDIPGSNSDLLRFRFAARNLGMQHYVHHHEDTYKKVLRERAPNM